MHIDIFPAGGVLILSFFAVMLAIEVGYRLGQRAHARSKDEKESPVSAMAGAILALGAFMLAFTFGIVSDRYDTRKSLVREEANAIATAWRRADFLPAADRAEAGVLLRTYLDLRLALAASGDLSAAKATLAETEHLQQKLWNTAVANARKDMNSDVAALYIDSLNKVFEVHAQRVAVGIQSRIPTGIWFVLFAITALGMMAVGYQTGVAGSNRSLARPILAVSFALVIELIAALDHPGSWLIPVSQTPLSDLRQLMETSPVDGRA